MFWIDFCRTSGRKSATRGEDAPGANISGNLLSSREGKERKDRAKNREPYLLRQAAPLLK
jgi:hypothetical protein